jgi:VIT1/CCC1 family predicted Fe2+/Mn2+ transporter
VFQELWEYDTKGREEGFQPYFGMGITAPPAPGQPAPDLDSFAHHWQDEADAAYLYRLLSAAEPDPQKKDLYRRLAEVEDKHVLIWAGLMRDHGREPKAFRPTGRTRLLAFLGKVLGPSFLLPMLLREEGREVKGYLDMHRATPRGAAGNAEALQLAKESAEHAETLNVIAGRTGEPWHRTESGGFLRNVVYGFNDGLTANFGLVAGVLGAAATESGHHAVIVAGVAGLIADALSMGSSGYLAAKSEQEVYANEIAMERDEVALMPEVERDELALIYEAKGMSRDAAFALASEVMKDPQRMLDEQVQEELGISSEQVSPMREAWITGIATAIGAFIPVFPFLVLDGRAPIILSFVISMASHWLVGAARSVFTGRSVFRSGMDMFVVGLGVAAVGYFVGEWIGGML